QRDQRRLTGAGRPDQRQHLARPDRQVDAGERHDVAAFPTVDVHHTSAGDGQPGHIAPPCSSSRRTNRETSRPSNRETSRWTNREPPGPASTPAARRTNAPPTAGAASANHGGVAGSRTNVPPSAKVGSRDDTSSHEAKAASPPTIPASTAMPACPMA